MSCFKSGTDAGCQPLQMVAVSLVVIAQDFLRPSFWIYVSSRVRLVVSKSLPRAPGCFRCIASSPSMALNRLPTKKIRNKASPRKLPAERPVAASAGAGPCAYGPSDAENSSDIRISSKLGEAPKPVLLLALFFRASDIYDEPHVEISCVSASFLSFSVPSLQKSP